MRLTTRGWTLVALLPLLLGIASGVFGFYWGQS